MARLRNYDTAHDDEAFLRVSVQIFGGFKVLESFLLLLSLEFLSANFFSLSLLIERRRRLGLEGRIEGLVSRA